MEKSFYMDENNNKVEYDDTYYLNGVEIPIPPMTKQETEELKEKLYGFTQIYKRDETLLNIIKEEAAPYFAGRRPQRTWPALSRAGCRFMSMRTGRGRRPSGVKV